MENINILPKMEQTSSSSEKKEKNWKDKVAEIIKEYTSEDSKLGKMAQVAINQVDKLKESDRFKWAEGISNMGYKIKETKAEFLSGFYRNMAGAAQSNRFLNTFFGKHANLYAEESQQAENVRKGEKKTISRLSGVGQGVGTMLRYGRMAFDAGLANPFRHVMAASMFVGKQSEALKETRYEYEGAKENTRVNDVDRAMEEAWDIYDKAQAESKNGEINVETLEKAYKKNLPKDIEKRFARADYNGLNFIQKGMNRHLEWATKRLTDKIEKIENSSLSSKEKEQKKEALMEQNKKLLNDLDAMVGDNATVDTIAYLARTAEKTGKTVSTVMMIESIPRLAKLATRLGGSLGSSFLTHFESSEANADTLDSNNTYNDANKFDNLKQDNINNSKVSTTLDNDQIEAEINKKNIILNPEEAEDEVDIQKSETIKATQDIKNINEAIVKKGDGVEHVFKRQLLADPEKFAYDAKNDGDVKKWAGAEAHRIAINNGYIDAETGHEVRIKGNAIGKVAYVLDTNEDGKTGVVEMTRDGDSFQTEEVKIVGEDNAKFETKTDDGLEKYEYEHEELKKINTVETSQNTSQEDAIKIAEIKEKIDSTFKKVERVKSDYEIALSGDSSGIRTEVINEDYGLAMVGIDENKDGLIDKFALIQAGDEYGDLKIEDAYETIRVKSDIEPRLAIKQIKEDFDMIIKNRVDKLSEFNLNPDQAQKIGIKIFDKDGINNLEKAQLKFATSLDKFDAEKIKDVFETAENYNYNLASGETIELQSLFNNINQILDFKDNSDFNPNQKLAIMEMFFSDPKSGNESNAVLKLLFGTDKYNELNFKYPDISPDNHGNTVLNLNEYKIIIETNGEAHIAEPRNIKKIWKIFNADAVKELFDILKGEKNFENTVEEIKNQAGTIVDRNNSESPIVDRK